MNYGVFADICMCEDDINRLRKRIFNEDLMDKISSRTFEAKSFENAVSKIKKFDVLIYMLQARIPQYMVSTLISEIVS